MPTRRSARFAKAIFATSATARRLPTLIRAAQPEIVFHLAAQPLVRASYREPRATFETNVMGTIARAGGAARARRRARRGDGDDRQGLPRHAIARALSAKTTRSAVTIPTAPARRRAKSSSRAIGDSFLAAQGVAVASARAGNVIGGGDWSAGSPDPRCGARLAGRADACRSAVRKRVRPWQHVLDPLSGYLTLGAAAVGAAGAGRRV